MGFEKSRGVRRTYEREESQTEFQRQCSPGLAGAVDQLRVSKPGREKGPPTWCDGSGV